MRNRFRRTGCMLHFTGQLLVLLGGLLLLPLVLVVIYWGRHGDGYGTAAAFVVPAAAALVMGLILRSTFEGRALDTTGSMLMCSLGWLLCSAFGALPFVLGLGTGWLDAYFEAMSGFTTTGITLLTGLDEMPRSILFWRSLTQWLGGLGILSFFLLITFSASGAHHIFGAESHKISSGRPAPGLFNTLQILWKIYAGFTLLGTLILTLEGMGIFDSLCHSLTALSTGGFSPHDASIQYYRDVGHANFRLIEYTVTALMMLGGINFLVHYRVLTRDVKALWDNIEIRYWWRLIALFTIIVFLDHFRKTGLLGALFTGRTAALEQGEEAFRLSIFQVVSILTTTGFGTQDIGSAFFGTVSRQLFLAMMVIGGCVGSTGGGFKVLRVAILNRLMFRELFKLRVSDRASANLVIDGRIVPDSEAHRVAALFFAWIALLVVGGGVSAIFSRHAPLEAASGMFSALGNIGPCYISVPDMIQINPIVKLTYIFGMLAGRLEILPVLLLFSPRAWR